VVNMPECLQILRRRLGDTDTPSVFTDDLLTGYIEDAVPIVETDFPKGIITEFGLFTADIPVTNAILFAIKAHYLTVLGTKTRSDRDNFLLRKGGLTLDNSRQSSDHKETLSLIDKEYRRVLTQARSDGQLKGIRME
jgi:hypothetical protein